MRGLFKLENAKIWGWGLIVIGVLSFIMIVVLFLNGIGRVYPRIGNEWILVLLLGLGIVFIVVGIIVNKICTCISQMMQAYDEELHKKFGEIKSGHLSKDSTNTAV